MQHSAVQFDRVARTVFAPVYPLVAEQVVRHTGIDRGVCLDIGCGPGYLGAALAGIADMYVNFFDRSSTMLEIARRTIAENALKGRASTIQGDVLAIALPDQSVDLAVSRGSIFFWDDVPGALREIYRVLAPHGWAYIGGGFGSKALQKSIETTMRAHNNGTNHFGNRVRRNLNPETRERFRGAIRDAGIESAYTLHDDEIGMWVVMQK